MPRASSANESDYDPNRNYLNQMTKKYTNGDITIAWNPEACIHSKLCWTQLGEVFNPRERPWVKMDGADTDRIIEQVSKCPSGALSYFRNEDKNPPTNVDTEVKVEVKAPEKFSDEHPLGTYNK